MDKLRSIDYFMKVAEARSIAAAANVLDVSPSAVSRVIAGFEAKLGFSLFHRTTRRLSLTADGELFLDRCRQILQELEDAEREGRQQRATPSGIVKVGMHPAFRNPFFGEIAGFFEQFPGIRVETKISNSPTILFDEGFDLLIRAGELSDSGLVARNIGWLELVVGASPSYLAKHGEPKAPIDLECHRWILPRRIDSVLGWSTHFDFYKNGEKRVITASSWVTVRDGIGIPECVIGGAGISCLYSVAFVRPIAQGLVKPLVADWTIQGRPVYAVFPNARGINPKTRALVEFFAGLVADAAKQFPRSSS
jgi:DNA-binding transcriptional LysR family regulator